MTGSAIGKFKKPFLQEGPQPLSAEAPANFPLQQKGLRISKKEHYSGGPKYRTVQHPGRVNLVLEIAAAYTVSGPFPERRGPAARLRLTTKMKRTSLGIF